QSATAKLRLLIPALASSSSEKTYVVCCRPGVGVCRASPACDVGGAIVFKLGSRRRKCKEDALGG
ncbi:hypothetical protein BaRGS_00028286, partial [Batillaria attramentaria]